MIFPPKNISNLFYIETSSHSNCSQGNFLFSVYGRETRARLCTFPAFSSTNNGKALPEPGLLPHGARRQVGQYRSRKPLDFQTWFWLRNFQKGNAFCIVRIALFSKSVLRRLFLPMIFALFKSFFVGNILNTPSLVPLREVTRRR